MINTRNKTTLLTTSILLTALLAIVAMPDAAAHQNPSGCNSSAAGSGLTVFFGGSPVTSVIQGQAVTSSQDLQPLTDTATLTRCAFEGQTDPNGFVGSISINNPDGSSVVVNTNNIPCIDGTNEIGNLMNPTNCTGSLQTFTSVARAYTVDCADDGKNQDPVDGLIRWTAAFAGRSHFTAGDTTPASKADTVDLECVQPKWTAKTDSSEKSKSLSAPIVNPTDTISVKIINPVAGTFSATFSIPDVNGVAVTGACVGGIVNVATGDASLLCSAAGTFGTTANTCWDVKVTPPAGYDPAGEQTFLGANDAANECFKVIPKVPEFEYFVGGGKILMSEGEKRKDNVYLTHGFELHCDVLSGPNNLEVNWDSGDGRFHLEQLVSADCNDDGSINEPPPSRDTKENGPGPTTDVYQGEGWGRYNGECGAFAEWVFDDNGEPGKADHIVALQIHDADGNLVLNLNPGELGTRDTSSAGTWKDPGTDSDVWFDLITGNHQWVPHPTPTHGPTGTQPCPEVN